MRHTPPMPRNLRLVKPLAKTALVTAIAGAALLGGVIRTAPAQAATPCWKQLLNDWYDGRIDQTYAVHCYRDALKHLPADVQTYSSAHDDILRALQTAIANEKKQNKPVGGNTLVPPQKDDGTGGSGSGSGSGGGGTGGGGTSGNGGSGTGGTATTLPGRTDGPGLAGKVSSNDPSSVPVPLIVLGAVALLLVAAGGAGLVAKRIQSRRAAS
jgi:uncharacterized membrane protein YgcG